MKIGVVGLGLIGGSIYRDLKALGYEAVAVSQSQNGEGIYKTYDVLKDCGVVFVCTPMNKTLAVLDELETVLPPQAIVADACSLKKFVTEKSRSYRFVPTHPMAGTEKKGFENSFEGLFKGAKWVITGESPPELLQIIKELGAEPVFMCADEHDAAAALVSHMPMVVAKGILMAAVDDEQALSIAGSGFRDMTRLAYTNEEMAQDMINMNSENIQVALLKLYNAIGKVLKQ